jgi:hypothetical protein
VDGGYGLTVLGVQVFGDEVNLVDKQKKAPPGGCN